MTSSLIEQLPSKDGILCRVWNDDITKAIICRVTSFSSKHLEYCCHDTWFKYAVPLNELELACYKQSKVYKAQMEKLDKMMDTWLDREASKVLLGE